MSNECASRPAHALQKLGRMCNNHREHSGVLPVGWSSGARRGTRAAVIFVLGVALSAVVNIVTSALVSNSVWQGLRWVVLAILVVLTCLGATLAWRHDREVPEKNGRSGPSQVVKKSYGPVVGEISGGNVDFHTNYQKNQSGSEGADA
jgi:cytochrome c biogenesis protein CcdA